MIAPIQKNYEQKDIKANTLRTIDYFGHPVQREIDNNHKQSFYLQGICLLFKKSLYLETGGLDNTFFMYFEETDWFWRLNLYKKSFSYVSNIYVNHYGSGTIANGKKIKYLSFLWRNQNCLQMLIKNYEIKNLIWVLPIYLLQNIIEITVFLIILKPKIAFSYVEGWIYNIKILNKTLKKRKIIQQSRLITDKEIFKNMYKGLGKFKHLYQVLGLNK